MRVREIDNERVPTGQWVADWSRTGECDYNNPAAVFRLHRPAIRIDLLDVLRPKLYESTYRDIMNRIDPDFLQQGLRSQEEYWLNGNTYYLRGVSYQGFREDTMVFYINHSTEYPDRVRPNPYYENLIKFLSWDDVGGNPDLTPKEKASDLLWNSHIELHCDDPSFVWWGYQYILTHLDTGNASIFNQSIPPNERNPHLRGVVCKHLNRVLHVLPFYASDISKAIIAQWGGKIDQRAIDAIRRRADLQRQANQDNPDLPPESDLQTVTEPEPMEEPLDTEEPEFPEDNDETARPV